MFVVILSISTKVLAPNRVCGLGNHPTRGLAFGEKGADADADAQISVGGGGVDLKGLPELSATGRISLVDIYPGVLQGLD